MAGISAPAGRWLSIVGIGEDGAEGLSPAACAAVGAAELVFQHTDCVWRSERLGELCFQLVALVRVDERAERAREEVGGPIPQHACHRGVHVPDEVIAVDAEERVGEAVDHGAEPQLPPREGVGVALGGVRRHRPGAPGWRRSPPTAR